MISISNPHSTVIKPAEKVKTKSSAKSKEVIQSVFIDDFYSAALRRYLTIEILLPPWYNETPQFSFPLLIMNDGQSMHRVKMRDALLGCYEQNAIPPMIVVGVYAGDRLQEYGVAGFPDYLKRGAKAAKYSRFVVFELLPLLRKNFRILKGPEHTSIAGFSLGGLSAFDMAWNYPNVFGSAGSFSGSFWWRSKAYDDGYDDKTDRIMHKMVRTTDSKSNQRFWFECGTEDERADRNKNGIIDSIEDTRDLIHELEDTGFELHRDVEYLEVEGGHHDEETWAKVLPSFLEWSFGKP
jgi:enterochelin esterase-like enzyme